MTYIPVFINSNCHVAAFETPREIFELVTLQLLDGKILSWQDWTVISLEFLYTIRSELSVIVGCIINPP